jgi:hypothetical protein
MTKNTTTAADWPEQVARRIVNHGHGSMMQRFKDREEELRRMSSVELKAEHKRLKAEVKRLKIKAGAGNSHK